MAFSPSWNVKQIASNRALVGTAPDPLHGTLSTHDYVQSNNAGTESWMSQVPDPGTVSLVVGEGSNYDDAQGGGGPVDYTPVSHEFGTGPGAALTPEVSQAQNAAMREEDFNATAAHRWTAPQDVDGRQITERLAEQVPVGEMGSPGLTDAHIGTSPVSYPNAQRTGHRMHFWRDRVFDRRTFTTDHRPLYTPNAYSAPNVPAGSGQYSSPFPQLGHVNVLMEQAPQLRRTPTSWSDAVVTDPTSKVSYVEPPLDVWGM